MRGRRYRCRQPSRSRALARSNPAGGSTKCGVASVFLRHQPDGWPTFGPQATSELRGRIFLYERKQPHAVTRGRGPVFVVHRRMIGCCSWIASLGAFPERKDYQVLTRLRLVEKRASDCIMAQAK
jgi:hypothetical protein